MVIIRETKMPLIVGVIDTIFFGIALIISSVDNLARGDSTGFLLCFIIFLGFVLLGVGLILDYAFRSVVLSDDLCYRQTIFHQRHKFQLHDIDKCICVVFGGNLQYCLLNKDGKSLAKFENNMCGSSDAIEFMKQKNIVIDQNKYPNKVLKYFDSEDNNNAIKNYSTKEVKKIRKIIKSVNYIISIMIAISFVFADGRFVLLFCAIVPLFWYGVYLLFYPMIVFDAKSGENLNAKKKILFPFISTAAALLLMLSLSKISNIQNFMHLIIFIVVFSVVLIIPYLFLLKKRETETSNRKKLSVWLALLFYCFSSIYTWNLIFTVGASEHEVVVIKDKHKYSSAKSTTSYSVKILCLDGEYVEIDVARSFYNEHEINSRATLCKRRSIFGIESWYIHN